MKTHKNIIISALGGMALLAGDVLAALNMHEREHVQSIVWISEAVTAVTIVAIFWLVWSISKRAIKKRKSKQEEI